jgi:hypothetical protein
MDACTSNIASQAEAAHICKGHTLKLHFVRHKYAAQIAAHTRAVERHARKLPRVHAKINAKAITIAGSDYTNHQIVGFDEYSSIA